MLQVTTWYNPYLFSVRVVRARSARISLFSFTSSEDSLVSITQPVILTIVVSLTRKKSTRILRKYSTRASRSNTGPSESNKGLKVRFRETLIAGASPVPVFGHKMVPAMSGTKLMIVGGFGAGSDQLNWRRRKSLAGFRNDVSMLDPQVPNVTSILPAHGPTLGGMSCSSVVP